MNALIPALRTRTLLRQPAYNFFNRFFEDAGLLEEKKWIPAINISENEKEYVVKAEVPGIDRKDINITLTNGLLTIRGERKEDKEDKTENHYLVESHYGSFSRTLRIPNEVEADKIDATYKDGILKVTVPKAEKVKPKKIEVN